MYEQKGRNVNSSSFYVSDETRATSFLLLLLFSFSRPFVPDSLQPRGLQHTRPPCPSPSPGVCPSSCPLHRRCHAVISSSDALFLCTFLHFYILYHRNAFTGRKETMRKTKKLQPSTHVKTASSTSHAHL